MYFVFDWILEYAGVLTSDFQQKGREGPYTGACGRFSEWLVTNRNNKNIKVNLDIEQFKPNEVSVKVVNSFVVYAKHKER